MALQQEDDRMIKLLVRAPEGRKRTTGALHLAAQLDYVQGIWTLLEAGADINSRGMGGHTPLMESVLLENEAAAKALLQEGADPNIPDIVGKTPLEYARANGNKAMIRILERAGSR